MPSSGDIEVRLASADDLAAEHAAFVEAQRELHDRHAVPWSPPPVEAFARVHQHLLDHDGERSFVAYLDDRLLGFSAALVRDDAWFLSALFVHPEAQGRGLGQELLDRSWGDDVSRRLTISEAIQPVSTGLYARRALIPTTPVLVLTGLPAIAGGKLEPAVPTSSGLAELDLIAYGFDRSIDHAFWAEWSAARTLWLRSGRPVAYSYVSPTGLIGPVAGRDARSAAGALREELARCYGKPSTVLVPGTAFELVSVALEAGLRLEHPGLLLLSPEQMPPRSLAFASFWLM
jgi:GNAT superfamily N-acetyltransferase